MLLGVFGDDIFGLLVCFECIEFEVVVLNVGSLNYFKMCRNGIWVWFFMLFDNLVVKIECFVKVFYVSGVVLECECFDIGIVCSVGLF